MQQLPSTELILNTYAGWAAQQSSRSTKDLNYEGNSYRDTRLGGDTTFSRAEVAEIMNGQLQAVVGAALKAQEGIASGSRDLIKAILAENDRQRVAVEIDAAAILNAGGKPLSAVELAEQRLASKGSMKLGALPSLNSSEAQAKQLVEAHEEIRRLNERMRAMTAQYEQAMQAKSAASEQALQMQDTVAGLQQQQTAMTEAQQAQMQRQNAEFRAEIGALRQQVVEAQKELTGKLSQSTQFTTLKRMLNEKNELVKTLRTNLARYDPAAAAVGADDDIEAASDDD